MKQLINLLAPITIVALHAYTDWAWILYLLIALYIFALVVLTGAVMLSNTYQLPELPVLSLSHLIVTTLSCSVYLAYFIFISNWLLLGLLVATLVMYVILRKLCIKK